MKARSLAGYTFAVACVIALAGCGVLARGEGGRPVRVSAAAVATPVPAVRILISRDVRNRDTRAITAIALIAPNGRRYIPDPAQTTTTRQAVTDVSLPGLSGSGGSSQIPSNMGIVPPTELRGEIVSTLAIIEIPAPDAYRAAYDQWTVKVTLAGDQGARKVVAIPAPPLQ